MSEEMRQDAWRFDVLPISMPRAGQVHLVVVVRTAHTQGADFYLDD